jgi:excisionase family DNA binding protein
MTTANTAPTYPDQRYTIPETAERLRVSRAFVYKKVSRGELRLMKDGKRSFVSGADIIAASRPA